MISFFVPGVPVPKGSAKAFYNRKAGKVVTMQTNRDKQTPWASLIAYSAQEAGCKATDGPVSIFMEFIFARPQNHYGTGRNAGTLKTTAPYWHTVTPDLDKLERCVLDALTGVAWHDDKQVVNISSSKGYPHTTSPRMGVTIAIDYGILSACKVAEEAGL